MRVSTSDAPAATFETSEDVRLRRGALSIEAPIQAVEGGAGGVVPASTITVINRPVLGISSVENPQATRFASGREDDEALRERIKRALQSAGRATTGALKGALTRIEGLREKDILISEDPMLRPGVVQLDVALPEMSAEDRDAAVTRALTAIEETRPVGVRIRTNIDAPRAAGAATPGLNAAPDGDDAPAAPGAVDPDLFMPVDVAAIVTPTALGLTNREREDLRDAVERAIRAFIAEAGIGETLVYNRLVAQLMALDGILDVTVELRGQGEQAGLSGRKNICPVVPSARPIAGTVDVALGGALVMIDVTVTVSLKGAGLLGDADTARSDALSVIEGELKAGVATLSNGTVTEQRLRGFLTSNPQTYDIASLSYMVTYEDDGLRINQRDVDLPLTGLERLWIRSVSLAQGAEEA